MAGYSYKDVVYRDDFQELIPEFEKLDGRECDGDPNYDGDYWTIADMLLTKKDETIRQQQAEIDRLTEQRRMLVDCIKDIYVNKNLRRVEHIRQLIAEIEAGK